MCNILKCKFREKLHGNKPFFTWKLSACTAFCLPSWRNICILTVANATMFILVNIPLKCKIVSILFFSIGIFVWQIVWYIKQYQICSSLVECCEILVPNIKGKFVNLIYTYIDHYQRNACFLAFYIALGLYGSFLKVWAVWYREKVC